MNSEKVKEIKYYLEQSACMYGNMQKQALTLINELESENERLSEELDSEWKERRKAEEDLHRAQWNYKIGLGQSQSANKKLKDRIAELEEALLDIVVQFCQMGEEGFLKHTFMSAEEQAFNTLEIQYGEKVSDVYKRFFKRWGRKYED